MSKPTIVLVTNKTADKQRVIDTARRQIEVLPVGEMRRAGMMARLYALGEKHGVKAKRP